MPRWIPALALFAAFAGLSQTRPAVRPASTKILNRNARAGATDAELERAIRARLARSKISATDKIQVHVQGGVATLEGRTEVLQHKGTATRLAKNAGATQVVNRMQVSQAARDKAAANFAQGRRAQVKHPGK